MRAVKRLGKALLAAALALAPVAALAQQSPPSANDAVGPTGLQNFSLSGTVTRPADQPPAAPKPQKQPLKAQTPAVTDTAPAPARAAPSSVRPTPQPTVARRASPPVRQSAPPAASNPAPTLDTSNLAAAPPPAPLPAPAPAIVATPSAAFPPAPASTPSPVRGGFPLLPWLFAALALGAGGAFLFWRNRLRHASAAGPLFDLFAPAQPVGGPTPDPAPAPAPSPTPRPPADGPLFDLFAPAQPAAKPAPPSSPAPTVAAAPQAKPAPPRSSGVVSTSLRPWVDIAFHPLRCIVEEQRVTVEFEIELFNSGSSPARAVLVEATLINAGATQDQEIDSFFANPVAAGDRIPVIQPLKRMAIRTQVSVPRDSIQSYEVADRQVFVPLIAFNTLYRMTSGEGQTSVSYLLGRETEGEKLAPFRLDLGPRIFRGLAARLLPNGVRR